jgi:hypothetical protein
MKGDNMGKRIIAIGDVHGEYEKFRSILFDANLVDSSISWTGGNTILVQTGDMIDRGPKSIESVGLIRSLKEQGQKSGGMVVRLFGNHELMLLQGDHRYINFEHPLAVTKLFQEEIAQGKLQAAWTDGMRLFSHAGVRTRLRKWLEGEKTSQRGGQFTPERLKEIAHAANDALIKGVSSGHYETPLFFADRSRGGRNEYGGIFWGHAGNLVGSEQAFDMAQVFGHTPTGKPEFEVEYGGKLINIDCGMYRGYGGNCGYLEITPDGQLIEHTKGVNSKEFKSRVLNANAKSRK